MTSSAESKRMPDASISVIDDALAFCARELGESGIETFWRESFKPRVEARLALGLTPREHFERFARDYRGHGSDVDVIEEKHRYVIILNECGSGARLRKAKTSLGVTRRPYPWSWGRAGIPYYCTHCCIAWEMLAAELGGHPIRIHECPENPADACISYVYKDPRAVPTHYFERIGMKAP